MSLEENVELLFCFYVLILHFRNLYDFNHGDIGVLGYLAFDNDYV